MNRIQVIGNNGRFDEFDAHEALLPGQLVAQLATDKISKHATSGGFGETLVVLEDGLQGGNITTPYAINNRVFCYFPLPGDEMYMYLKAGEVVVKGDVLISAGDGTLIKTTGTPAKNFAIAREAKDLSAGGSVATRIRVRIL